MKQTTDFVNAETGEVLGSINAFLDVLINPIDYQLAHDMATHLVSFGCAPENYNKPIIVMATRDFEDGRTIQVTATFKQLLGQDEEEEEEDKEEND